MPKKEKPLGIGSVVGILLVAVSLDISAFLFDLLYLIPAVGWVLAVVIGFFLDIFGVTVLSLWFYFKGVKFVRNIGGAAFIEMIPIINALPVWSLAALMTIVKANGYGSVPKLLTVWSIKNKSPENSRVQADVPPQQAPSTTTS